MIRSVKHLQRFEIVATDGSIGAIDDFYFDDDRWAIRYIVVDTGKWWPGRRVLISPYSVVRTEWGEQRVLLSIARQQVRDSPGIDTHQPVSRQHEANYLKHFGYPYYWGHAGLWGAYPTPLMPRAADMARRQAALSDDRRDGEDEESQLRAISEVTGYLIRATDGDLGHVDDFLIDDVSWAVRYLVINTSNWWFGHHVLAAPRWITAIDWVAKSVNVNVTRAAIKSAPAYDRAEHVDRQWEDAYHQHVRGANSWLPENEGASPITPSPDYLEAHPRRTVERRSRPR